MASSRVFSAADHARFADINAELRLLLPQSRPRSEAVHRCALLFIEVRDKGYQEIAGHDHVEPWMWQTFKVQPRQAGKYFHAASIPAAEVAGKHQGIEVMGQIGQEKDEKVREAMWQLAEDEHVSELALRAGRMKMHPYLEKGRRQQGIEIMRRKARKVAEAQEAERQQRQRTPRTAGQRGVDTLHGMVRLSQRMLDGKAPSTPAEQDAMIEQAEQLLGNLRQLAQRRAPARQSETAAEAPKTAPAAPSSPTVTVEEPKAPVPTQDPTPARAASARTSMALHLPAEVLAFRPLFRFFHEGLTPGRKDCVQDTLAAVVRGDHPDYRIQEMHRALRPFLPDGHPMKKHMTRLAAGLRARGVEGQRFALYCLMGAQLPGLPDRLLRLGDGKLPRTIQELVLYYRDLLLGLA